MTNKIRICHGTGCLSSQADKVKDQFDELGHKAEITGCHGFCSQGPIVTIDEVFYPNVKERDVKQIVEKHLGENELVDRLFYKHPITREKIAGYNDIPFYARQHRLILANCGHIDPENIDDYLAVDGYKGLEKALKLSAEEVIDKITKSGLKGRGGAGFPTGLKWKFARNAPGEKKYVIINADEGDPGAFMDRSILEADPHSVIEGVAIGAYAIGADEGVIYVRAEYPLAVIRFKKAIEEAKARGYLGKNILGTDFSFDIRTFEGAGAFVCGEETALITSIEGNRGNPVVKPPFPATSGLWKKPTNINNVKTWASAAWIMKHSWEEFKKIGTEDSPGTAIFSLTGKVKNSGLVEVPMGTSLREIIYEIGGGIEKDRKFKAVQTGGPSGGCIPEQYLDTAVDYKTLAELGSIMGSGGMVVIDERTCIVDFAKFFIKFCADESCGKCTPCREGTLRAYEILDKISSNRGTMDDLERLEELSQVIKDTSLCGLGMTAPNPILSTLRYFREEYLEHIEKGFCKAGVCEGMFDLVINQDVCISCGLCLKACGFESITGNRKEKVPFVINTQSCTNCRQCLLVCPKDCIDIVKLNKAVEVH
ncbi:MAG: NADH-quinone oxidoreductase subunit NuoF [Candidatus Heimdallarchaeota archaeon]|nr:NADH-quinone oxidoreductase subunit NuoF [Candidatus Heimdallarchaeota archaeon]